MLYICTFSAVSIVYPFEYSIRAARLIFERSYETPSSNLLEELKWHKLHTTRRRHKAILMYKTLNGNLPHYLQEIFTPRISYYDLKDIENKLFVPKSRTDYLKPSFGYSGAVLLTAVNASNEKHKVCRLGKS